MKLYMAIAALALYGDLLKRVIGATGALFTIYAIFGLIIATCFAKAYAPEARSVRPGNNWFSTVCLALLGVYLIQMGTNFDVPLFEAVASAFYIVLPLTYIVTITRCFPQFDLYRLGQSFLVLMPPIVAVALVQYFVDESFMVDMTYGGAGGSGGVIARNLMDDNILGEGTYYNRLPSLMVSADRLSAVGMMHLYFCVLVLHGYSGRMTTRRVLWLLFSVVSAIAVLMIAGARGRILVVGAAIALAGLPMLKQLIARGRQRLSSTRFSPVVTVMVVAMIAGAVWAARMEGNTAGSIAAVPMVRQLKATAEKGDVWDRTSDYFTNSFMPDDVTVFGRGLGTVGVGGRPGERAVTTMWIESGFFWTLPMLLMHAALVLRLTQCLAGAFRRQTPYDVFLCAVPLLLWVFGLLTGFTVTFELTTALTLFPAVAVITAGVVASPARGPVYVARFGGR